MTNLPYGRQLIDDDDIDAVERVLRTDWLTTGPAVEEFETRFAERVDAPYAVACANGTAALHLAAMALGLGPGDTAVVPSITFVATANVVRHTGAEVVFADVDPETGNAGPREIEEAIARGGPSVRAVFAVHYAGLVADLTDVGALTRSHGLRLVEDACHALGGCYRDRNGVWRPIGSGDDSDLTAFSFHPVKTITTAEGGMVTTRHPDLYACVARFRNHGLTSTSDPTLIDHPYVMEEPGFNYRLSDLQCALGISQLGKLDSFAKSRAALAIRYDALFSDGTVPATPLHRIESCDPTLHLYVVRIPFAKLGITRARVMHRLKEMGIRTQVHYIPVHRQPYYVRRYGELSLPGAESFYAECLSLPLFPGMRESDADRVHAALAETLGKL